MEKAFSLRKVQSFRMCSIAQESPLHRATPLSAEIHILFICRKFCMRQYEGEIQMKRFFN